MGDRRLVRVRMLRALGGYYARVVDPAAGKTLYTTGLCATTAEALRQARRWVGDKNAEEAKKP